MEQQTSELDSQFFDIYNQWKGETCGTLYSSLWEILIKAVRINLLSQLRKSNVRRRDADDLILETVCRFLPRLVEKKRHGWVAPYGPVALTSMDTNYILHCDRRKQEDRESVDYADFENMKLKEEEECF